jgi:hypothetical protein
MLSMIVHRFNRFAFLHRLNAFPITVSAIAATFRISHSPRIVRLGDLVNMLFMNVRHFNQFAFLPQLKP